MGIRGPEDPPRGGGGGGCCGTDVAAPKCPWVIAYEGACWCRELDSRGCESCTRGILGGVGGFPTVWVLLPLAEKRVESVEYEGIDHWAE